MKTTKKLSLKSGSFAYDAYKNVNGLKMYKLLCSPAFGFPEEKRKQIAIEDGAMVDFIGGNYWLTF